MRESEVKLEQENKTGCLFYVSLSLYFGFYTGNTLGVYLTGTEKDSNGLVI